METHLNSPVGKKETCMSRFRLVLFLMLFMISSGLAVAFDSGGHDGHKRQRQERRQQSRDRQEARQRYNMDRRHDHRHKQHRHRQAERA